MDDLTGGLQVAAESECDPRLVELSALVANTAESLEGIASIVECLSEEPDMPRALKARLTAVRDALALCAHRTDRIADLLDEW